jgi:predicted RNase H-like nuclease (RuvC/YqgF family)
MGIINKILGHKITLIIIIALIVAFGISLRWYGNKKWSEGESKGRQSMAEEILKSKEKEWKEKETELSNEKEKLKAQFSQLERATSEITNVRLSLRNQFSRFNEQVNTQRIRDEKNIIAVPNTELRDAIRSISRELAQEQ